MGLRYNAGPSTDQIQVLITRLYRTDIKYAMVNTQNFL